MTPLDVIVVGAGPAGSYAAYRLAKSGLRVQLLEEHPVIGEPRHCTGVLGQEAFDRFPDLPRHAVQSELKAAWIVSPAGEKIRTEWYEGQAYVIQRAQFDRDLAAMAEKAGAHVQTATTVQSIDVDKDGVRVSIETADESSHELRAHAVVLATGISYQLQTQLGLPHPKSHLYCAQMEVASTQITETEVYIGKSIAPGSFAWSVPVGNGRVRVGVTAHRMAAAHLETLLKSTLLKDRITLDGGEMRRRPVPIHSVVRSVSNRVVVIGDAAGQVKPTTGGGIYYGLIGAELAAETLKEAFRVRRWDAAFLRQYDRAWKKQLSKEMWIGRMSRKVFERFSDAQLDRLVRICHHPKISEAIRERALFDWHGKAVWNFLLSPRVLSKLF